MTSRSILQFGEGAKQERIVLERSARLNLEPGRGDGVRGVRAMRAMRALRSMRAMRGAHQGDRGNGTEGGEEGKGGGEKRGEEGGEGKLLRGGTDIVKRKLQHLLIDTPPVESPGPRF